jgi:hypothetical protein
MDTEKGHLVCDGCALAMGGDALWKMLFEWQRVPSGLW